MLGARFLRAEGLSQRGIQNDTIVRERINAMTREERKSFIRLMFTLLESTGAKTLTDLHRGGPKTVITMIKAYRDLSEEEQDAVSYLWDKLFGIRPDRKSKADESPEESPPEPPRLPKKARRRKGKIRVSFFPLFLP